PARRRRRQRLAGMVGEPAAQVDAAGEEHQADEQQGPEGATPSLALRPAARLRGAASRTAALSGHGDSREKASETPTSRGKRPDRQRRSGGLLRRQGILAEE